MVPAPVAECTYDNTGSRPFQGFFRPPVHQASTTPVLARGRGRTSPQCAPAPEWLHAGCVAARRAQPAVARREEPPGRAGDRRAQGRGPIHRRRIRDGAAKDTAAALLKGLGAASRKGAGSLRSDVLQRRDRPNHFAIAEARTDQKARDATGAAAHMKHFRDALKPLLSSAYAERPHTGLAVGSTAAGAGAQGAAVYTVTRVDIIPPKKDDGIAALQPLAGPSRMDAGTLRYEVWQQISRPNHFTPVEIWKDHEALEGHEVAAHTTKFRDLLLPMSGSLYDQRLYKALDSPRLKVSRQCGP